MPDDRQHYVWCPVRMGTGHQAGRIPTCTCGAEVRALQAQLTEVEAARDGWMDTAREFSNGLEFYRGIVQQTGAHFGPAAYTSDDGSVQDSVLALKVPELAAQAQSDASRLSEVEATLAGWQRDYRALFDLRADIEAERDTMRVEVARLQRRERERLGICHWTGGPDAWVPLCEGGDGRRWTGPVPGPHCPFCGRLVTVPTPTEVP